MNENLIRHYNSKYIKEKDKKHLDLVKYQEVPVSRHEACFKYFVDNFSKGDILELGTGDGSLVQSLLQTELEITSYTASDISSVRLEGIKNKLKDSRLKITQVDAEELEISKLGKYDAIIMVALIEHLIDPIRAMQKLRSLLKPNGFIYIDTPNIADYGCRFKLLKGKFPSTASRNEGLTKYDGSEVDLFDEGHLHYFTYRSITLMLTKNCGFSKVEKYYFPIGKFYFGKKFHYLLAKKKPELFSGLVVIAYSR